MGATCLYRLPALSVLFMLLLVFAVGASQEVSGPAAASINDIRVSFKLDPSLTRGMYMGDRWVSPPTYLIVGEGQEVTVEARVEVLDSRGNPMKVNPSWVPADSGMILVTPAHGNEVKITVKHAGQSKLLVTSQGISREVIIKATYQDSSIRVEISQ